MHAGNGVSVGTVSRGDGVDDGGDAYVEVGVGYS
jgi:hypothetical protein